MNLNLKDVRYWNIVAVICLSISTFGFGYIQISFDQKIADHTNNYLNAKEINTAISQAVNHSREMIFEAINWKHSASLLDALGKEAASKEALEESISLAKGAIAHIVFAGSDIDMKETLLKKSHWEADPKAFSKLDEIKEINDLDVLQNLQREYSTDLYLNKRHQTEFTPKWINNLSATRNVWWIWFMIIQTIGLICGVVGRILESNDSTSKNKKSKYGC